MNDDFLDKIKKSLNCKSLIYEYNSNLQFKNSIIERTNYLSNNSPFSERYFHIKNELFNNQKCPICDKYLIWTKKLKYNKTCGNNLCIKKTLDIFYTTEKRLEKSNNMKNICSTYSEEKKKNTIKKIKETNIKKYGVDSYVKTDEFKIYMKDTYGYVSPFELEETHKKSKNTLIEKTGYDHNFKIPEVREKIKNTFLEKYGYDVATKNDIVKEKIKNTNIIKYNNTCPLMNDDIKIKSLNTLMKNYNVDSPLRNNDIFDKFKKTMLMKYNVEFWAQCEKNFDSFKHINSYKEYTLPNNTTVKLQGYEDYVLHELLKEYDIDDILYKNADIHNNVGYIYYYLDNKKHKYYPDFFIKSKNLIIEVKSKFTYEIDLNINLLKKESCINNGINFEFRIIDKNEYKNWKNKK